MTIDTEKTKALLKIAALEINSVCICDYSDPQVLRWTDRNCPVHGDTLRLSPKGDKYERSH